MRKQPKTFRLAEAAVTHLEAIAALTGSSQTAVVEQALAMYHTLLRQEGSPQRAVGMTVVPQRQSSQDMATQPQRQPLLGSKKLNRQQRRARERQSEKDKKW